MDTSILGAVASDIPIVILVLIIEHIAISKSFGRVNNYIINPSQELVAIGFTNVFGPFLGGYPATGSFSRTAIKSKAGVRTPLAGIFTAIIVLLALYALTSVFFYIPSAGLAAIIIHAVGDLITPPREVYKYWQTSPLEVVVFFAGVLVSIFTSIENGIYTTMAFSFAILLWRIAKSPGHFLGKIDVYSAGRENLRAGASIPHESFAGEKSHPGFVPFDKSDLSNPDLAISSPAPGVFVYRFSEGLNYINSARHLDALTIHIFKHTRRTEVDRFAKLGDRPWNDPGPRRGQVLNTEEILARPTLRAVVLDFTAVNLLDVTSAQALIDLRDQFNRYAEPDVVEWHFAGVCNRWTKRALVAAGFGADRALSTGSSDEKGAASGPLIAVAGAAGSDSEVIVVPSGSGKHADDIEGGGISPVQSTRGANRRLVPVYGINRPFFHIDLETAVKSAVQNLERGGSESN